MVRSGGLIQALQKFYLLVKSEIHNFVRQFDYIQSKRKISLP